MHRIAGAQTEAQPFQLFLQIIAMLPGEPWHVLLSDGAKHMVIAGPLAAITLMRFVPFVASPIVESLTLGANEIALLFCIKSAAQLALRRMQAGKSLIPELFRQSAGLEYDDRLVVIFAQFLVSRTGERDDAELRLGKTFGRAARAVGRFARNRRVGFEAVAFADIVSLNDVRGFAGHGAPQGSKNMPTAGMATFWLTLFRFAL